MLKKRIATLLLAVVMIMGILCFMPVFSALASTSITVTVTPNVTVASVNDIITFTVSISDTTGTGFAGIFFDVPTIPGFEYVADSLARTPEYEAIPNMMFDGSNTALGRFRSAILGLFGPPHNYEGPGMNVATFQLRVTQAIDENGQQIGLANVRIERPPGITIPNNVVPANVERFADTPTAPGTPAITTVTPGDRQARIAFTVPADGGSPITGFNVTAMPGNITATGTSSPITVTGLTNGTAYTFTVTATNAAGLTGVASAESDPVTPEFGVPNTGIPGITGYIWVMIFLLTISAMLWGTILRQRLMKGKNG
jgi:hypothetical protein